MIASVRYSPFIGLAFLGLFSAQAAQGQTYVRERFHTSGSCASCDLSQKSMTRMQLVDADFSNSNFFRSNLSGGRLDRSNLAGAVFSKAYLVRVQGADVDFSDAVLRDATLTDAQLTKSHFMGADMRRADLSSGQFGESDFSKADLSSAIAKGADFSGAILREARLPMATLDEANLTGADMQDIRAADVSLAGATLKDANLVGADLRNARGLTQEQLDTACGDSNTRLPLSFSVPYCDPEVIAEFEAAADDHDHVQGLARLDNAIRDVEGLVNQPGIDLGSRRRLQRIHSQLVASRRSLAQ